VPVDFIDNSSAAAPETLSNPFNGALKFKHRLEVDMVQLPAQLARHLNGKLVSSALRRQLGRCNLLSHPIFSEISMALLDTYGSPGLHATQFVHQCGIWHLIVGSYESSNVSSTLLSIADMLFQS
jgi:hypothetical protein